MALNEADEAIGSVYGGSISQKGSVTYWHSSNKISAATVIEIRITIALVTVIVAIGAVTINCICQALHSVFVWIILFNSLNSSRV